MKSLLLACVLAIAGSPVAAFDVYLTREQIDACVTAADYEVAVKLWENQTVQDYFVLETSPNDQHRLVESACVTAAFMHKYPNDGADTDFFSRVEESSIGDLLYDATEDTGAWSLGVYVALHELSHGRTPW